MERPTPDESIPDSWSPANRLAEPRGPAGQVPRTVPRDEIDAFRNLRLAPPATLPEAIQHMYLAQEWYEHAQHDLFAAEAAYYAYIAGEDTTREGCISGLLDSKQAASRNAAEKVVDVLPVMLQYLERKRALAHEKARRTLELSIARRRHAVAVTMLQVAGTTGFLPHVIYAQQFERNGEHVVRSEMEQALAAYRERSAPAIAENMLDLAAAEDEAETTASGATLVAPVPDVTAGDTEAATSGEGVL